MQVYLVGGAVRDQLLGRPVGERDWVVVGGTPEELRAAGYRAVGREFPVFLHPETREEYALARLERKVAPGYRGFVTEFSPAVTLEQDLQRRDLTINAMARDEQGRLIDPYGGAADIEHRWLRHVSAAFSEDPVRILRVARFAARFAPLGFRVAPETEQLMRDMVASGEVAALVPERVWRELERALGEPQPEAFFGVLQRCGALPVVMPEIAALLSDTGQASRAIAALRTVATAHAPATVRWTALLATLPETAVDSLCKRLRAPTEYRELALLATRLRIHLHGAGRELAEEARDPAWLLSLLEEADAFRRPERYRLWLQVLQSRALAAGVPVAQAAALACRLQDAQEAALAVKLDAATVADMDGPAVAALLRERRLAALKALPAP